MMYLETSGLTHLQDSPLDMWVLQPELPCVFVLLPWTCPSITCHNPDGWLGMHHRNWFRKRHVPWPWTSQLSLIVLSSQQHFLYAAAPSATLSVLLLFPQRSYIGVHKRFGTWHFWPGMQHSGTGSGHSRRQIPYIKSWTRWVTDLLTTNMSVN